MEKKVPKFSCPEKKLMSRDSYRDLLWKILTSSWSTFHKFYSDRKGTDTFMWFKFVSLFILVKAQGFRKIGY